MKSRKFMTPFRIGIKWVIACIISNTTLSAQQKPPSTSDEAIAILTRYDAKPAYQQQLQEAFNDYVTQATSMEHNIMAEAYTEQENHSVFWVIERWDNKKAFLKVSKDYQDKSGATLWKHALLHPATVTYVKDLEPISKQQWRQTANAGDQPLVIILFVDAKPGTAILFKNIYHTAMPKFRGESGVINYQLSQLEEDGTRFVTYEKFRNEAAFQYHLNFPPILPVIDYLNTSITKQPFQSGLHRLIPITPLAGR